MTIRRWITVAVVAAWLGVGAVELLVEMFDPLSGRHFFAIALVGAALLTIARITMPHAEMVRAVYAIGRADERRERERDRVPLG